MPNLHVIATGSLLEFALNNAKLSKPMGRVEYLFLKPLSFTEFLAATENEFIKERLADCSLTNPPDDVTHSKALGCVRDYMILGGMPAVIDEYRESKSCLTVRGNNR